MFYYLFNYTMTQTSKKENCILSQQMVMYIWIKKQHDNLWRNTSMAITKDMIIADVLNKHQDAMAHGETIEEACAVHGLDCDALVTALNDYLTANG